MKKPNSLQHGKKLHLVTTKDKFIRGYRLYRGDRLISEIEDIQWDFLDAEGNLHKSAVAMDITSGVAITTISPGFYGRSKRKEQEEFEKTPLKFKPLKANEANGFLITKQGFPVLTIENYGETVRITAPGLLCFLE